MRARRFLISLLSVLTLLAFSLTGLQTAQAGKPTGSGGSTSGISFKIQGFDKLSNPDVWTPGNTAGYAEQESIPFRVVFSGAGTVSKFELLADADNGGIPGFEDLNTFRICDAPATSGAEGGTPPAGQTSCPLLPQGDLGGAYVTHDADRMLSGVRVLVYTLHNVTVGSNGPIIVFGGKLAIGSHRYPGSALHIQLGDSAASTTMSSSGKNVPIPVNGIIATETDKVINGDVDDNVSVKLGDIVNVSITGKAFGPTKLSQQLTIRDELPDCLDYEEGSGSPAPNQPTPVGAGGTLTWGPFTVKNGSTKTVTFQAKVVAVGTCTNTGFTHSDSVPTDSEDDVLITSAGVPNVSPDKECDNSVAPGDTAECTITVKNFGSATSAAGTVTDVLDPGLTFVAGTPAPASVSGQPATGQTVTWNVPALAPGGEFVITYGETVPATGPAGTQQFEDTATTHITGDGNPDDDSDTEIVTVVYTPDLDIDKGCPSSVTAGSTATYTIDYGNSGDGNAEGVTIEDTLPAGTTYNSSSRTPTSTSGGKVVWSIGALAANTTGTQITLTVNVVSGTTFTNKVDVKGTGVTTAHDECTSGLDYSDVGIGKDCGGNSAQPNDLLTHTLTIGNSGNQPAANVVVTDTLPTGLTREGAPTYSLTGVGNPTFNQSGQVLTWTFASLPAGAGGTITYQVRVADFWNTSGVQEFTDAATIATSSTNAINTSNDSDDCTTSVDFQPHLTLTKSACPTTVVSGGYLTYTLTYANDGHAPATGVVLTDTPSANQPIVSAPGHDEPMTGNTATWTIGTVGDNGGGTRTLVVLADAEDGTVLTNSATLSATNHPDVQASSQLVTVTAAGAQADASAYGLSTVVLGVPVINPGLSASSASAPGGPTDSTSGWKSPIAAPITGGLLVTTSHAEKGIGQTSSMATSTVLNLGISVPGAVTISADVVSGVSSSAAGPFGASSTLSGSRVANLVISGSPGVINGEVPPNTTINVSPLVKVVINEQTKSAAPVNGKWTTSASVNMLHVTVLSSLPGVAPTEIIVAHAQTSAAYPVGLACGAVPDSVSGKAFTAEAVLLAGVAQAAKNVAEILPYGGHESVSTASVTIPGALSAGVATSRADGTVGQPPGPNSSARATAANVDLGGGAVKADLVEMTTSSLATGSSADTTFLANFVNLTINGTSFGGTPPANTVIDVPPPASCLPYCPLIHVVLNEQTEISDGLTNTEGTGNAIHLRLFSGIAALTTDVIVVSAHSDSHRGG